MPTKKRHVKVYLTDKEIAALGRRCGDLTLSNYVRQLLGFPSILRGRPIKVK